MEDSIFSKIIKGEIPCYKVYEDDKTLAFLDIYPTNPGHTLVIPKIQVESVWDLPAEYYAALMDSVQKVALRLREVTGKKYVGSKVIGTDVPHAHVHLFPFTPGEDYTKHPDTNSEPNHQALAEMQKQLEF